MNRSHVTSCNLERDDSEFNSLIPAHTSCALVMADSQLLGIFTESDLVRLTAEGRTLAEMTVGEAMKQPVTTFQRTEVRDLFDILSLTRQHKIRHFPIVDKHNQLLGIVTLEAVQRLLQPMDLLRFKRVDEVMSNVLSCALPTVSVLQVTQLMIQHQVSCVVIAEPFESHENSELRTSVEKSNLRPVGIITERDIIQFQSLELNLGNIQAQTLMSTPLFLVNPFDSLWSVHQQMQQRRVRRLIVAGEQGELKGIITQNRLLQSLDPKEMYRVIEVLQRQVVQLGDERAKLLQNRAEELEEQVKKRTFELESANQKLQQEVIKRQQEIIKRRQIEQQLIHDSLHDRLTGLPNRTLLIERIEFAIQHAKRHPDYLFALLFIDLDRFKTINDSLGHLIGDRLLITVAKLLQESLRDNDLVARLGGDEFVILLDGIHQLQDAIQISTRIQELLASPFDFEAQAVFTTASMGIVLSSTNYDNSEDLLRDADIAMYRAKKKGKGCYEVFDRAMYLEALNFVELENNLRLALQRGELILHYQPIVSLSGSQLVGLEALIRWQHPQRGLILPNEFIPIAEDTGLIVPIGEWLVAEACQQLKIWQQKFAFIPEIKTLKISINVANQQFQQPQFIQKLDEILLATGLNGSYLQLEITESVLVEPGGTIQNILAQIKKRNIKLSIDDFGTGYSCLSYLSCLPIDNLKIDRSFIKHLNCDAENFEIVRTILTLAKTLGIDAISEGIERLYRNSRGKH
ncbi:MAG: EAL domain-containing protein [Pleurocapsa sp. MO_226.B13]|nr:EAL domain-containing protein [Pleurocapsa sp. MO_226.B13]